MEFTLDIQIIVAALLGYFLRSLIEQQQAMRKKQLAERSEIVLSQRRAFREHTAELQHLRDGMRPYAEGKRNGKWSFRLPQKPESIRNMIKLREPNMVYALTLNDYTAIMTKRYVVVDKVPSPENYASMLESIEATISVLDSISTNYDLQTGSSEFRGVAALPHMIRTVWMWAFSDFWLLSRRNYQKLKSGMFDSDHLDSILRPME